MIDLILILLIIVWMASIIVVLIKSSSEYGCTKGGLHNYKLYDCKLRNSGFGGFVMINEKYKCNKCGKIRK